MTWIFIGLAGIFLAVDMMPTFIGLAVVFLALRAIYRLYFHPLAKIPGPKLAAISSLPEFYYDVIRDGRYLWQVEKMHKKYGMSTFPAFSRYFPLMQKQALSCGSIPTRFTSTTLHSMARSALPVAARETRASLQWPVFAQPNLSLASSTTTTTISAGSISTPHSPRSLSWSLFQ